MKERRLYPWLIWVLGAGFFLSEYFARVSPSVMVPDLMRSFHVTALGIGSLSAFFYYAYVSMQVPVGALVDRFGPHRLMTITAALCGLSCFLFAASNSIGSANFARFIMGFSAAFAFVGTLKLATLWFPAERFGLLSGATQALGMLGAAIGEGPVSFLVQAAGWRKAVILIGSILIILAILIGFFVRDSSAKSRHLISYQELWRGFRLVMHNPQSWLNALFAGLLYAPTAAFAELWGVSFLSRTDQLSTTVAASAVSCIFLGWALGGPISGWISDRIKKRRPIMIFSVIASLILMILVLYVPNLPAPLVFILLFVYGMANTGVATAYAVAAEINPRGVAGTSMAFANMASVLVGAAFQPMIGWLLDKQWNGQMINGVPFYSAHAFRMAMLALPACLVVGWVVMLWVKETHCQIFAVEEHS